MIRSTVGQSIGAQMVDASSGGAFVGAVTVYLTLDAGVQAIGTVGSGLCTHEGNGYHTYRPSLAETNADLIAFTFIGSGAIPRTIQVATVTPAQQSALQTATGAAAVSGQTLVTDALTEIGIIGPADPLDPAIAAFVLGKFNRLIDNWNAEKAAVYTSGLASFVLTPNLSPHTIGPNSATVTIAQRPVTIEGANLILTNVTPTVRLPLKMRDAEWWRNQPVQGLTSSIPTDLYYATDWPNGSLYFWPVPTTAFSVELDTRVVLVGLTLAQTVSFPPGYRDALTLTLAEDIAASFGQAVSPMTSLKAGQARARIFANNDDTPRLATRDAGMPGGRSADTRGNYRTGWNL